MSAAALATTQLITSVASTALGIYGSYQQAQAANAQAAYQQASAKQQADIANMARQRDYINNARLQAESVVAAGRQVANNNQSANRSYVAEQERLNEAKRAAAFKSQENYIKSIGAKGSVLASGMSGKSIGLLALDAERQAGFAEAQSDASLISASNAAGLAMDIAESQNRSANNQAYNSILPPVAQPFLIPT